MPFGTYRLIVDDHPPIFRLEWRSHFDGDPDLWQDLLDELEAEEIERQERVAQERLDNPELAAMGETGCWRRWHS